MEEGLTAKDSMQKFSGNEQTVCIQTVMVTHEFIHVLKLHIKKN